MRSPWKPGVGVHQGGGRPPLGCSSLQDLVNLVLVVDHHLLQPLHHHAALQHTHRPGSGNRTRTRTLPAPVRSSHLVAGVVEQLQALVDVLGGAQQVEQLLVVDLQQRNLDGELGAVLAELLEDLVQRPRDDAGQRVLQNRRGSGR